MSCEEDSVARCDREIAEILAYEGECRAWLLVLALEDWEAEKRLLLQQAGKDS